MDGKWNTPLPSGSTEVHYDNYGSRMNTSIQNPQGNCTAAQVMTTPGPMVNVASNTYPQPVPAVNRDIGQMQPTSNYQYNVLDINQQPQNTESSVSEAEQNPLCFICSNHVADRTFECLKASMNHSHAPLLVLLSDVLGYKLEETKLHSKVVCKACFHLLDIIDELQQTLTESKTDVRTKFLQTLQRFKLKYPRTDKMLKPRCIRCIQISQSTPKKRGRGRLGKLKEEGLKGNRKEKCDSSDVTFPESSCNEYNEDSQNNQVQPTNVNDTEENIPIETQQKKKDPGKESNSSGIPKEKLIFDCDREIFSPNEKLKVGLINDENGQISYCCMYCRNTCDNQSSLKLHVRVYHLPTLVHDNGQGTADTRYRMGIKLQNTIPNDFVKTEKPFSCLFCESSYKLQSSLQSHFRTHHSPIKPFQCIDCKDNFRMPIELSRHRLYRCPAKVQVSPKRPRPEV